MFDHMVSLARLELSTRHSHFELYCAHAYAKNVLRKEKRKENSTFHFFFLLFFILRKSKTYSILLRKTFVFFMVKWQNLFCFVVMLIPLLLLYFFSFGGARKWTVVRLEIRHFFIFFNQIQKIKEKKIEDAII